MGEIKQAEPVLLLVAAFSQYDEALDWFEQRCCQKWGSVALASPRFVFQETDYYQDSMGSGLQKAFLAFETLADASELADWKIETNGWEAEYATLSGHSTSRPLNIDPGYITSAKLVLASTKDHAHRIYLRDGIYAEVTLYYQEKQWRARDWTFPDYRRTDYQAFFQNCRTYLRSRLREGDRA